VSNKRESTAATTRIKEINIEEQRERRGNDWRRWRDREDDGSGWKGLCLCLWLSRCEAAVGV
jgi:hypothetical protein